MSASDSADSSQSRDTEDSTSTDTSSESSIPAVVASVLGDGMETQLLLPYITTSMHI